MKYSRKELGNFNHYEKSLVKQHFFCVYLMEFANFNFWHNEEKIIKMIVVNYRQIHVKTTNIVFVLGFDNKRVHNIIL